MIEGDVGSRCMRESPALSQTARKNGPPGGLFIYSRSEPDFLFRRNCNHASTMVERVPTALMTAVRVASEVGLLGRA